LKNLFLTNERDSVIINIINIIKTIMEPIKRFNNSITEGNLWIYVLALAKEVEIKEEDVNRLIFEKFGFLPNTLMIKTVLFRLRKDDYITKEKLAGKKAYKTSEKGIDELGKMREKCQDLLQKI
jgi:DNA-binding PadR family transcriptional regulator